MLRALPLSLLASLAAAQGEAIVAVPFTRVTIDDGFWSPRLRTSREVTIPYAFEQCEKTGRIGNFARAGGLAEGGFEGQYPFDDSDVYKVIEGAAYALHLQPDPKLDDYVDGVIAKIAAAQEDDGYLYTARTLQCERLKNWFGDARWEKEQGSHELYNAGHLFEAACAHFEATGKRSLLDVALKVAERIAADFGAERERKPPGHQGIEIGLCRLFQVTGERRWLELARFFLEVRGVHEGRRPWGEYCQDHLPVLQQKEAVGHAVRAAYMYAGMADVAALTGERKWLDAIDTLWRDVVSHKLYLTGGIGATGAGEAFGKAWELPNASAYCETCAAIANVFWNHRLFLAHGDGRYVDVLERSLYNNCLSGIALDGRHFFYPNPLASFAGAQRSPWFGCACCPSNDARFIPSLGRYAYAQRGDALFVNLYLGSTVRTELAGGALELEVETDYPWTGEVAIAVAKAPPQPFRLRLRIPGWARGEAAPSDLYAFVGPADGLDPRMRTRLRVNGDEVTPVLDAGYAEIARQWQAGDRVALSLPMTVWRVRAHPEVADCRDRLALQRGPLVYCVEGVDVSSGEASSMVLDDKVVLGTRLVDLLGGMVLIQGGGTRVTRTPDGQGREHAEKVEFSAIPYYAWAHRGRTDMAVWLATTPEAAIPGPAPTLAFRAKKSASHNGNLAAALSDQMDVIAPGDKSRPFFHWWPKAGTVEWAQYDFAEAAKVDACEVYWLHDRPRGNCDYPASWRVLWRDGEEWKPVDAKGEYLVEPGAWSRIEFAPVETPALRLEVQLKERRAAGAHEWRVREAK